MSTGLSQAMTFHMPTRVVHGTNALHELAALAKGMGIAKALVVSDPTIARLDFYRQALDDLRGAGIALELFEQCGIDARLAHVDSLAARVRETGVGAVIAIGGGSVMCTGKAVAITAANSASFSNHVGYAAFATKALPQIMVPTTAGSGSEVSQYTIVKDEASHRKLVGGGPLSFPEVAILDPVVLASVPGKVAAIAGIDAMTHALEACFTELATPLTDAMALAALRCQLDSLRASIHERSEASRNQVLLAAAMANIACGNARLGLAHSLSFPLESRLDLAHGLGVGVLMPRVLAFNAPADVAKLRAVAEAFGIRRHARRADTLAASVLDEMYRLYDDIAFPRYFEPGMFAPDRIMEMAREAARGLWGGGPEGEVRDDTLIHSPNVRKANVGQARQIYESCFA